MSTLTVERTETRDIIMVTGTRNPVVSFGFIHDAGYDLMWSVFPTLGVVMSGSRAPLAIAAYTQESASRIRQQCNSMQEAADAFAAEFFA